MIVNNRAYSYAKWCCQKNNKYVGKYVKLQAKAWLKIADGKDKDAYVDEKAVEKVCKLLRLMVHPDLLCSMYKGLEDYAWFFIIAVLCTYSREEKRRFYARASRVMKIVDGYLGINGNYRIIKADHRIRGTIHTMSCDLESL